MSRSEISQPPRVFISYSDDTREHQERVLELADRLRAGGVDARLDQYEPFPFEGWPVWMQHGIEAADWVLVICTAIYRRRFERREAPGAGRGGTWEGAILTQELSVDNCRNRGFVPVTFCAEDEAHIPTVLRGASRFRLAEAAGYDLLYRVLTDQNETPMPELGRRRELPPKARRTSFLGEPTAPAPAHRDERSRALVERLRDLQRRHHEVERRGEDTATTRAELLSVNHEVRKGGQLRAGEALGKGRYELIEPLGEGGFGRVWKAWDIKLRRCVAIKVLHRHHGGEGLRKDRFFRGAREMAKLDHPGIVRVLEVELEEDGFWYFVMEYLPGGDLQRAVLEGRSRRCTRRPSSAPRCRARAACEWYSAAPRRSSRRIATRASPNLSRPCVRRSRRQSRRPIPNLSRNSHPGGRPHEPPARPMLISLRWRRASPESGS